MKPVKKSGSQEASKGPESPAVRKGWEPGGQQGPGSQEVSKGPESPEASKGPGSQKAGEGQEPDRAREPAMSEPLSQQ